MVSSLQATDGVEILREIEGTPGDPKRILNNLITYLMLRYISNNFTVSQLNCNVKALHGPNVCPLQYN